MLILNFMAISRVFPLVFVCYGLCQESVCVYSVCFLIETHWNRVHDGTINLFANYNLSVFIVFQVGSPNWQVTKQKLFNREIKRKIPLLIDFHTWNSS